MAEKLPRMIDLKIKKRERHIVIISSKKTAIRKPVVDFGNRDFTITYLKYFK